jgi:CheY-like chemotaxis protein
VARVLVCDDDESVRSLLEVSLSFDHDVVTVANGQEALDHLRSDPTVDVLLLDVMMPVKDGLATLRELRADASLGTLPVIMLTAKAMEADASAGREAGVDHYLTKPFDPLEVEELIEAITGN